MEKPDTPSAALGQFFADWARGRRQERVLKEIATALGQRPSWTCDACGIEYPIPPDDQRTIVCFCDEDTRTNVLRGEVV